MSSFAAAKDPCILALRPQRHHPAIQARPTSPQITIRQLLTHYSGLPEDVDLKDPWGLTAPDKAEGIRRALAAVPYGPPGLTFRYSDINFITLGYLVEALSGRRTLEIRIEEHLSPAGYGRDLLPTIRSRSASSTSKRRFGGKPSCHAPKQLDLELDIACPDIGNTSLDTAPTAHDDQGTPATNPNFDHLLRGTVHDPTTRRMGGVAGHAGVFSTAHDMSLFCQALLDKLLHNTGPFPLSQATLKLATSPNEPASAVNTATIFTQDGQTTKGIASHGLGWDLNTAYSRPRGTIFPITTSAAAGRPAHPGSFGHTGFTGTSLWLDPTSDTYVILLSNAIHIPHAASISPLRGQIATAAAHALGLSTRPLSNSSFWVRRTPVFRCRINSHPQVLGNGEADRHPEEANLTLTEQTSFATKPGDIAKHLSRTTQRQPSFSEAKNPCPLHTRPDSVNPAHPEFRHNPLSPSF